MASVSPNTERNRWSVERMLGMGSPGRQALTFNNWTAGLDGATLARTVRELMGKSPSEVN
jgi:hypothetical protein